MRTDGAQRTGDSVGGIIVRSVVVPTWIRKIALLLPKEEMRSYAPANPAYSPATAWEREIPGTPFTENDTGSAGVKSPRVLAGTYRICWIQFLCQTAELLAGGGGRVDWLGGPEVAKPSVRARFCEIDPERVVRVFEPVP